MELKVLLCRVEAGSRPSKNQFWPLPWGMRCGKEGKLGCDLLVVGISGEIGCPRFIRPWVIVGAIALYGESRFLTPSEMDEWSNFL
jgi:hypothetical protein